MLALMPFRGRGLLPLTALFLSTAAAAQTPVFSRPVFSRDVSPILYRHCIGCHHSGEVAPFSLVTYEDAKKHAQLIAAVVQSRTMPPWEPVAGYGQFEGERHLTTTEIATLVRWSRAGAPEGDARKTPPPPSFPDDWKLGPPDLVVQLPAPFEIPAEGGDIYECFVVPMKLTDNRNIRAFEFRPSNRRVVHHALFFTDTSHISREPSYSCFGTIGLLPTNGLGGWSPGNGPVKMLQGAAIPLAKGSRLVAQIHYHPDGKVEQDQWRLGLYFAKEAPVRHVVDVGLTSKQIDIPVGDSHYVVRDHFVLPVDIYAVGVIPHAHYLCKEMRGWATLPGGRKVWLLNIRNWDFNWQDQYRYKQPLLLPEDSRIEMEFVYDNSASNPRNPHSPPQRVTWGPSVDDEMAGLHVQAIPVRPEDGPELGKALWGKVMRSVGGSFYRLPQPTPPQ